jgi:hypothetical protein
MEVFDSDHLQDPLLRRSGAAVGWRTAHSWVPEGARGARWTGWLNVPAAGRYPLRLEGFGRARLWLDGKLLLDAGYARPEEAFALSAPADLIGRPQEVRIEYLAESQAGELRWLWQPPSQADTTWQPVPVSVLSSSPPP